MDLVSNLKKAALVPALLLSASTQALDITFDINGESFAAELAAVQPSNNFNYSGGFLATEKNGNIYHAGIFTSGQFKNTDKVSGGIGSRFYYVDTEEAIADSTSIDDFQAISFGGYIDVLLPIAGFSVDAELYIAPSMTTFQEADGFTELSFRAKYEIFENAHIFTGFRDSEIKMENVEDYTFNDGVFLGFTLDL